VEWEVLSSNALEVQTRVFMELICSMAVSFSEPQLSTKVSTLKYARSQNVVFDSFLMYNEHSIASGPTNLKFTKALPSCQSSETFEEK
jgi:hypothetical protein